MIISCYFGVFIDDIKMIIMLKVDCGEVIGEVVAGLIRLNIDRLTI